MLIHYGASMVVHLLLLKFSMCIPILLFNKLLIWSVTRLSHFWLFGPFWKMALFSENLWRNFWKSWAAFCQHLATLVISKCHQHFITSDLNLNYLQLLNTWINFIFFIFCQHFTKNCRLQPDSNSDCKSRRATTLTTGPRQCDQIKIAKCLIKFAKNGVTGKMNDCDTFTKIA